MVVTTIAESRKDFFAQEELNLLLMCVLRNVVTEETSGIDNVTTVTSTVWTDAMEIAM